MSRQTKNIEGELLHPVGIHPATGVAVGFIPSSTRGIGSSSGTTHGSEKEGGVKSYAVRHRRESKRNEDCEKGKDERRIR